MGSKLYLLNTVKIDDQKKHHVEEIEPSDLSEKKLQTIFEQNLGQILGLELISSEFSIKDGASPPKTLIIDTLAYDRQNKRFVIIEYKKDKASFDAFQQVVQYHILMSDNNKEKVANKYGKEKGKPFEAKDFDWELIPIILIAKKFNEQDIKAVDGYQKGHTTIKISILEVETHSIGPLLGCEVGAIRTKWVLGGEQWESHSIPSSFEPKGKEDFNRTATTAKAVTQEGTNRPATLPKPVTQEGADKKRRALYRLRLLNESGKKTFYPVGDFAKTLQAKYISVFYGVGTDYHKNYPFQIKILKTLKGETHFSFFIPADRSALDSEEDTKKTCKFRIRTNNSGKVLMGGWGKTTAEEKYSRAKAPAKFLSEAFRFDKRGVKKVSFKEVDEKVRDDGEEYVFRLETEE